jgi:MerR family transcriptional regulator, copper efflux regulator
MRITEAAQRLGTSPRMLRYREVLGLLPPVREPAAAARIGAGRPGGGGPAGAGGSPGAGGTNGAGASAGAGGPARHGPAHRRFDEDDLAAAAFALRVEQRYDITPAALAFGLRVLTESAVRADVAELGRRIGRIGPPPARALEFEKERALRLLSLTRPGSAVRPGYDGLPGRPAARRQ